MFFQFWIPFFADPPKWMPPPEHRIPSIPTSPSIARQGHLSLGYRIGAKKTWGCLKVGTRKKKKHDFLKFILPQRFPGKEDLHFETWDMAPHIFYSWVYSFTHLAVDVSPIYPHYCSFHPHPIPSIHENLYSDLTNSDGWISMVVGFRFHRPMFVVKCCPFLGPTTAESMKLAKWWVNGCKWWFSNPKQNWQTFGL